MFGLCTFVDWKIIVFKIDSNLKLWFFVCYTSNVLTVYGDTFIVFPNIFIVFDSKHYFYTYNYYWSHFYMSNINHFTFKLLLTKTYFKIN